MTIRFITPDLHGLLDYSAAAGLIVLPLVLNLQSHSTLVFWASVIAGLGLIGYSFFTDYKLSPLRVLSFKIHLWLDGIASAFFLVLGVLHQGTTLSLVYCLVMGSAVVAVISLSRPALPVET